MIRKYRSDDADNINEYIARDYARNYFIALGLLKGDVFKDIYIDEADGKIKAILFHRKSNNLQFCAYDDYDKEGFIKLISSLDFDFLISAESFCSKLKSAIKVEKAGATISVLNKRCCDLQVTAENLSVDDLEKVQEIYKNVFTGYPRIEVMKEKLLSKRGRGVCIKIDNEIVSVAQSEFETENSSLIVGVATNPEHRNKGYASKCLKSLSNKLLNENKSIYLQYDNPDAGKIYEKIGFKKIDQVYYYKKG